MVSVSADGEVFPCHMMHDEAFSLGSLVEDPSWLGARAMLLPRAWTSWPPAPTATSATSAAAVAALAPISPRATSRPAIPIVPSCGRSTVCFLRPC